MMHGKAILKHLSPSFSSIKPVMTSNPSYTPVRHRVAARWPNMLARTIPSPFRDAHPQVQQPICLGEMLRPETAFKHPERARAQPGKGKRCRGQPSPAVGAATCLGRKQAPDRWPETATHTDAPKMLVIASSERPILLRVCSTYSLKKPRLWNIACVSNR